MYFLSQQSRERERSKTKFDELARCILISQHELQCPTNYDSCEKAGTYYFGCQWDDNKCQGEYTHLNTFKALSEFGVTFLFLVIVGVWNILSYCVLRQQKPQRYNQVEDEPNEELSSSEPAKMVKS